MKDILLVLFLTFNIVIILLLNKYKNTRAGNVIGSCWLVVVIGIFYLFFRFNFNLAQNIFIAIFGGLGLLYFFYNFKRITKR